MTILSGCNVFGNSIPNDISKEYYKVFVDSYELYEERVKEYNGKFIDNNGELIPFGEEGIFTDPSILEVGWEDAKRKENGEEGLLTEAEDQLMGDFIALYYLKQFDAMPEQLKQMSIDANPEYKDPIQAAINLEEKIIKTLKLNKKPITASLINADSKFAENDNADKESAVSEQNYEPKYMSESQWAECIRSYSEEECINIDRYYADGDGQREGASSGEVSSQEEAYWAARNYIHIMNYNSDRVQHSSFEDSIVEQRDDGLYYVYSTYVIIGTGVQQDSFYEYEMLLDQNFELVDAYLPGTSGMFSRPMVYDALGQSAATVIREDMDQSEDNPIASEIKDGGNDPYEWAPGIKEKFENEMITNGYVNSKDEIRYKEYRVHNNQGFYEVYAVIDGEEVFIVVVNVKTGEYHG